MKRNFENVVALIATSTVLIFGLAVLGSAHDGGYMLHGCFIVVAAGFGVKFIIERMVSTSTPSGRPNSSITMRSSNGPFWRA